MSEITLKTLYDFIQVADTDEVGVYHPRGFGDWTLHIYSSKRQVNVCRDGLSHLNVCFPEGDDNVHIYKCDRPGYANYDRAFTYPLDCPITALHASGQAIEIIRDMVGPWAAIRGER